MESGSIALVFFYGIFWASVLNAVGRLRAFDTHTFFSSKRCRYAVNRFLVALFIINLVPVGWFCILYVYIVPNESGVLPIMVAAFASLSVFGFHRILHAIIATSKTYSRFYVEEEWKEVIQQWSRPGPNTFVAHFLPGVAFLLLFPAIALIITCL